MKKAVLSTGAYSVGLFCNNCKRSAISGPRSRPVTALRSGMKRDFPLRPVASFTAFVQFDHASGS